MLRLTRRTEYGLMALACLAGRPDSYLSSREIVEKLGVPRRLLAEILKNLCHARLVDSVRGPNGGYRLRPSSLQVSLAKAMEALEGPLRVIECVNGGHCCLEPACVIQEVMVRVSRRVESALEAFTLADLASSKRLLKLFEEAHSAPAREAHAV